MNQEVIEFGFRSSGSREAIKFGLARVTEIEAKGDKKTKFIGPFITDSVTVSELSEETKKMVDALKEQMVAVSQAIVAERSLLNK